MNRRTTIIATIVFAASLLAMAQVPESTSETGEEVVASGFKAGAIGGAILNDAMELGVPDQLEGIRVELRKAGVLQRTTRTNSGGYYVFADLEPGDYEVRVQVPDGRVASATAEVALGTTTALNLAMIASEEGPPDRVEPSIPIPGVDPPGCFSLATEKGAICAEEGTRCLDGSGDYGVCRTVVQTPYPGLRYSFCVCL